MPDIWGDIGSGAGADSWLYQERGEVRGPVPKDVIVQRMMSGEIGLEALVAREGGEFHPIARVAAFEPHLEDAQRAAVRRSKQKNRKIIALGATIVLAGLGSGGYFVWQDLERAKLEQSKEDARRRAELEAEREKSKKVGKLDLVALVSLGEEKDVKVRSGGGPKRGPGKQKAGREEGGGDDGEKMVSECELAPGDMVRTLQQHLSKINVCVEDEKKRDTSGQMPGQLVLSFVVKPDGRTTDFDIDHRHYRTGPMKNCMTKVFNMIKFPQSGGSNCLFDIPIKIGS